METLHAAETHREIFASGKECYARLRPGGLLSGFVDKNAKFASTLLVKKLDASGAVFRFPADASEPIIGAAPKHACDDRLSYLVADWSRGRSA
jgi:hypothetical protein